MIPFVDLKKQNYSIKSEIDLAISDVIEKSSFIRGPHVDIFERKFSQLVGRKYAVSCANGTDALYIAMKALDLKEGDEIIAPAHSWISTTETITQAGGKVVFCDTTEDTFTMCPKHLRKLVNKNTVGIIPVHLYGQPADMDEISAVAGDNNLWIIEDCAQAHLAKINGMHVGSFGRASTYSFYPGKNLGAIGDAGAVNTDDHDLMMHMTKFARHGGINKGDHEIEGINSRMDGLQAAILNVKLKYIEKWTKARQDIASRYLNEINNPLIKLPVVSENKQHVWHLFVVKTKSRDKLKQYLVENGISTNINYKVALPFLPAYKRLGHVPSDFPNAYTNQHEILSIPIYPELSEVQLKHIIDTINNFK